MIINFLHKLPVPNITDVCKKSSQIDTSQGKQDPKQLYEQGIGKNVKVGNLSAINR
jgi:hypothetical protein